MHVTDIFLISQVYLHRNGKEILAIYWMTPVCSENKGADQLRGYREADLRLCFRICKTLVFLMMRLISRLPAGNTFPRVAMDTAMTGTVSL